MSSVASSNMMKSLTADAFLKLFITQLRYQDPNAPMDPSQMTAQLAQLTSVQKLNDISVNFGNVMRTERLSLAKGLIGSTVGYSNGGEQVTGVVESARVTNDDVGVVVNGTFVSLDDVVTISAANP